MAALAKDPAQRWQTADDFAEGLEAARAQIDAGANGGQSTSAFAPIPLPAAVDPARGRRAAPAGARHGARGGAQAALALVHDRPARAGPRRLPDLADRERRAGHREERRPARDPAPARARRARSSSGPASRSSRRACAARSPSTRCSTRIRIPARRRRPARPSRSRCRTDRATYSCRRSAGLPQAQAIKELEDAGLKVTRDVEFSDEVRKGLAIRTVPREGEEVTVGTRVRLLVSQGPERTTVPDVVGLSRSSADSRLRGEGLGVAVAGAGVRGARGHRDRPGPGRRQLGRAGDHRDDHRLHGHPAGERPERGRARRAPTPPPRSATPGSSRCSASRP